MIEENKKIRKDLVEPSKTEEKEILSYIAGPQIDHIPLEGEGANSVDDIPNDEISEED